MILDLTPDQDFLRDTTAKFLASQVPTEAIRALRDDVDGFDHGYWRRGADLGWTSLLVKEEHGGGSVSGQGLVDLTLIAHEFGRAAAPGPLLTTNVAAAALSAAAGNNPSDAISRLLDGSVIVAWCLEEPAWRARARHCKLTVSTQADAVVLNGAKRPVEYGAQAELFVVTGDSGDGLTQVLVPASAPGVTVRPLESIDLSRRYAEVRFDQVHLPLDAVVGDFGQAADAALVQLALALAISNAESVGAMERLFEMTMEWAFDRYSFGRPLASYQELKHRFADMKSWLEAAHAISDASAAAVHAQSADYPQLVSAAKAYIGHYAAELAQDCLQIHGGIGVTFDHDLHLYLRRITANRSLLGSPADHRQRVADLVFQEGLSS